MSRQDIFTPIEWVRKLQSGDAADQQAAQAFEAIFRALIGRSGDATAVGDRLFFADIGVRNAGGDFVIDRKLVISVASGQTITLDPAEGVLAIRSGGFMRVFGCEFGANSDLFEWFGPDLEDVDACATANAISYRRNNSGSIEETQQAAGDLNYSATSANTGVAHSVEITHGPGGTSNGNTITVSYNYTFYAEGLSSSPVSEGAISCDLSLTRDKSGGGAVEVATPQATGSRTVFYIGEGGPGYYWWTEEMSVSGTYTDPDTDTAERVFNLSIDARTGPIGSGIAQTLTVSSFEPA